jgi:hypothetical protein
LSDRANAPSEVRKRQLHTNASRDRNVLDGQARDSRARHRGAGLEVGLALAGVGCAVALLAPAACLAQEGVTPFSGRYQGQARVLGIKVTASAQLQLRRSSKYLLYTMDSTVKAPLYERRFRECSVIAVEGDRMVPREYRHTDVSNPGANVRTVFDWPGNKASTVVGPAAATTQDIAWPTWDPMSYQVALMALAPKRKAGQSERQLVIERGRIREHNVRFSGAVTAPGVPAGVAVHELLLSPQMSWQPLRIVIDEVAIDRDGAAAGPVPAALPEGVVPTCAAATP